METVAAKSYVEFVKKASDTFFQLMGKQKPSPEEMDLIKIQFSPEEFKRRNFEFNKELIRNCENYKNKHVIVSSLKTIFKDRFEYILMLPHEIEQIMNEGFECEFLIQLANSLFEANYDFIWYGCKFTNSFDHFYEMLEEYSAEYPEVDERLDFNQLKSECNELPTTIQKIDLITNRLYDFKQWKLEYDKKTKTDSNGVSIPPRYQYSSLYYPNFEQLCTNELERLTKILELEKQSALLPAATPTNGVTPQAELPASLYRWAKKDVDLVELIAALSLSGAIVRSDGSPITRIELMHFFGEMLNKPINAPEQVLSKLIDRNYPDIYIKTLSQALYDYRGELQKKKDRRDMRGRGTH